MALDLYQPCPCGSGKKIKFCCSRDILPDLEKLLRAVEGEQRVAALDQVNKLIAAEGPRAALLVLKANIELELDDLDASRATLAQLFKGAPHNPVALALSAAIEAISGELETAVERLQESLEYVEDALPSLVYSAIATLASALLEAGLLLAARGHLMMLASLTREKKNPALEMLMQLNRTEEIPLLLKQDHQFEPCAHDAPWRGEFEAAMRSARRGAWLAACESLSSLAEKVPGQPAIVKNVAILRGWLGQTERAAAAWHHYAALDGVPLQDAVEAEALAQLLERGRKERMIPELTLTYRVTDMERLMERLLSDRRAATIPIDLQELATEDQPPPRAAFYLLNMPRPDSGVDLTYETVPRVLGEMYVYGKETDRDARLEFVVDRTPDIEGRRSALAELVGDLAAELQKEEVTGEMPASSAAAAWRLHLPRDTPYDLRVELARQLWREVLLRRWPEIPLPELDDKSPREASADARYRIRVLAAILVLELWGGRGGVGIDFDDLRRELGLPALGTIDPTGQNVVRMPMARLGRLDLSKLSDDDLLQAYGVASLNRHVNALYKLSKEILARPSLKEHVDRNVVYGVLVGISGSTRESLEYVERAHAEALARGQSPAPWLLAELSIRWSRGEAEQCQQLLETIRARHITEPGIASGLRDLLISRGVLRPDGRPAAASPGEPAPTGATAAETNKLWTPGSGDASPTGEAKPKIWIPGSS